MRIVADWKEHIYPDEKNTSDQQWAWEFLRRSPEYQSACQLAINAPAERRYELEGDVCSTYRLGKFVPPQTDYSEAQAEGLFLFSYPTVLTSEDFEHFPELSDMLPPKKNEAVAFIDLRIPLQIQFDAIKAWLDCYPELFGQVHISQRKEHSQFIDYLKILDATACGAPQSEQAEFLQLTDRRISDKLKSARDWTGSGWKILAFKHMSEVKIKSIKESAGNNSQTKSRAKKLTGVKRKL